jgi:hypothetical protein
MPNIGEPLGRRPAPSDPDRADRSGQTSRQAPQRATGRRRSEPVVL